MRTQNKWISITAVAALFAVSLAGCGGGSDNGSVLPSTTNITRATEANYSDSARILAARDAAAAGATWLSSDAAAQYDADLAVIRTTYPQVSALQALPDYNLHNIVVTVKSSVSWVGNWQKGNQTTGEKALDDLLTQFAPEKIETLGTPSGDTAYFVITFGQSLNMVKLAEQLKAASANIASAEPNYTAGDGNNIRKVATTDGNGTRQYVFSQGWGDCPAGCINRHQWNFTVSADGKTAIQISETGTPLVAASAL